MKYSAESAVFHAAFQLFERQVLSANIELENLSKKDCDRFIPIITTAVEEICEGLQEKHNSFTKQLWNFNLHLILFLKLFSQQKLQNKTEKLYEKVPCKDDLLIIVGPLPHVPTAFYFELVKTCDWNLLFTECLSLLNPEEIHKWMVLTIQHCQESPQSANDLLLLTALVELINETCLPEDIQEFWLRHKETGIPTDTLRPDFNLISVREMLCDHSEIVLDLLNGVEQLLTSASEEAETSASLFWNAHKPSRFGDIFFDLTLLGIAVYGDSFEIGITLSDLLTTEELCNLNKGQLSDLTQNVKKWLDKEEDIQSLSDLYTSATKYSSFKECRFRVEHLKSLDSKCLEKIIFDLYLYFKCWSISDADGAVKDGAIKDGTMKDGALKDEAIKDSTIKDGAMKDGALKDGALKDGTMKDGTMKDGAMKDGTIKDGTMKDGALKDGAIKDGTIKDGTIKDGAVKNGVINDGTMKDKALKDGAIKDGTMKDGALKDGAIKDGTLKDGAIKDGAMKDGAIKDGAIKDGAMKDGALKDGALKNGTIKNGTMKDRTIRGGAMKDGTMKVGAIKDQKSALKFCSLCEKLVSKSRLHLLSDKESSSDEETSENDVIDQMDFILERLKIFYISFDKVTDAESHEENILPEEKLAEMLKDENLESWKDERFFIFLEAHPRELSNPDLYRLLWERVNWLANISGEEDDKKLTEKYVTVLLDSFSYMDPLLQDYVIRDFYLPIKCETDRPWWRRSSCFQKQLALSLNKLTERNFTKIPTKISQYALLDFETVLRTSISTAIDNACQVDVIAQLLILLPVSCQISCNNTDDKGTKKMKSPSLLGAELEAMVDKLDANQQNAFLELVTQLIKPVSTGVRKQFGVTKYLISIQEVFHFLIFPRLHLSFTLDADQPNPLFILQLLLIALKSEQIQQQQQQQQSISSIGGLHLHVVLLQICHVLNDTINSWKKIDKKETCWKLKPLLISAVTLLEEIILNNLPPQPDKVLKWLRLKLSILDWTVQLRLRKLLFFKHQNSEESLQLSNEIILSFLKTQEITQSCDLQQTLQLFRIASVDEEICTSIIHCLPSYILFSRDCVTVAIGQLLPNFLPEEVILICRLLLHLIENSQLIVLCQAGFLPSVPCLDLSGLKSHLGLSQLFMDVIVLQNGFDNSIGQHVFDNIFSSIKTVLLSPAVFSKINPMLSLILIYQLFSVMNILINVADYLNVDKILLFLVELVTIFKQHFSMFYPVPKKRKRGITKSDESELSTANTLEFNLNETMIAGVNNEYVSSDRMATSPRDKFFIALILELLTSMIDQIDQLSNYEIKSSILKTLDEMKIPFLKVCRKIE